ncbi:unnamed protein product, partial [Prorocentrum cordatum]
AFPFWEWDDLCERYHEDDLVTEGFDNAHALVHKNGGKRPQKSEADEVSTNAMLFEDTVQSHRALKLSDARDIYNSDPHKIGFKQATITDTAGVARSRFVQVNPDQPCTIVNVVRRRAIGHEQTVLSNDQVLWNGQADAHYGALVDQKCADMKAFTNAPTHEEVLAMAEAFKAGQVIAQANREIKDSKQQGMQRAILGDAEPDASSQAGLGLGDMGPPASSPRSALTSVHGTPEAKAGYAASVVTGAPSASGVDSSTDVEVDETMSKLRLLMGKVKIHRLLAGHKRGHQIRCPREHLSKSSKDDQDYDAASSWLSLSERAKKAGDQKAKDVASMNRDDLDSLSKDLDKESVKIPPSFQRALWDRAVADWKNGSDWGTQKGTEGMLALVLPWGPSEESVNVDEPQKFSCLAPVLSQLELPPSEKATLFKDTVVKSIIVSYLQAGKSMLKETLEMVSLLIAQIKAMPMSCEVEVDNSSSEVMLALKFLNTIGGSQVDTLSLVQVDKFVKAKATTIEGSLCASLRALPFWHERLQQYLKYSPSLKYWCPIIKDYQLSLSESPNDLTLMLQCISDVSRIEKVLPPSEITSYKEWVKGVVDRFVTAALQVSSQGLALPGPPDDAENVVKMAVGVFGTNVSWQQLLGALTNQRSTSHGRALLDKFIGNIGTYNSKSLQYAAANFGMIEGLRGLASDSHLERLRDFSGTALDCILGKRGTWPTFHAATDFDAAWKWVNCASRWFEPVDLMGPDCPWESFRKLLDKVKVNFALVKSYREIIGENDILKDRLAETPLPLVGAFLGLLEQASHLKADDSTEEKLINDTFMEGFEAAALQLKLQMFEQITGAGLQAFVAESEDVPLSKVKGGPVDKLWSEGLADAASIEDAIAAFDQHLAPAMSFDSFKEEVSRKFQQLDALTETEQRFGMAVPPEKKPEAMVAICRRAAQTLCEYQALEGIEKVGSNAVAVKKFMMTVVASQGKFGVEQLVKPVDNAVQRAMAMESIFQ